MWGGIPFITASVMKKCLLSALAVCGRVRVRLGRCARSLVTLVCVLRLSARRVCDITVGWAG